MTTMYSNEALCQILPIQLRFFSRFSHSSNETHSNEFCQYDNRNHTSPEYAEAPVPGNMSVMKLALGSKNSPDKPVKNSHLLRAAFLGHALPATFGATNQIIACSSKCGHRKGCRAVRLAVYLIHVGCSHEHLSTLE